MTNVGTRKPAVIHHKEGEVAPASNSSTKPSDRSSNVTSEEESTLPEWKQQLPVELQNKTHTLKRIVIPGANGCRVEVYLLGTAHVSVDSSRDVSMLLESIEPSVLFLELCDQRIPMMLTPPPDPTPATKDKIDSQGKRGLLQRLQFWKRRDSSEGNRKTEQQEGERSMYGMASGLLTSMQEDYAKSLGVELGGEFRVAYNYWDAEQKTRKLHMILGDRPLYLTLTRAWESLGVWGKTKLIVALIISTLQKPNPKELREWLQKMLEDDSGDLLTESIAELANHFPSLERVIIKERDAYLACKLYQTCRFLLDPRNPRTPEVRKLVAVVGAGHIKGICHWLTQGNGETPEQILGPLIEIRKRIPEEDRRALVEDVMEVNPDQLKLIAEEMGVVQKE